MSQGEEGNIRKHLQKQFDAYLSESEVPEELKTEVFKSLDRIRFAAEFLDLFTGKFTSSELEFLDLLSSQPEDPPEEADSD